MIAIKNLDKLIPELPVECGGCIFCFDTEYTYVCALIRDKEGRETSVWECVKEHTIPVNCPLVEVPDKVETNIYDEVERIENCTVEILRNSITGEESVGWYRPKEASDEGE